MNNQLRKTLRFASQTKGRLIVCYSTCLISDVGEDRGKETQKHILCRHIITAIHEVMYSKRKTMRVWKKL